MMRAVISQGVQMKRILIIVSLFSFISNVLAEGYSNGVTINHIASVNDSILFGVTGNTFSNRPACASTLRFSVHKDSPHAAVVLTAFAAGKKLGNVRGLGTCTQWGNSEDLKWIEVSY